MATVYIDQQAYDVDGSRNLLDVCLGLGFDLPYFCWHPAMGSVGACRQCAVKQFRDGDDRQGRVVVACMTPASEGTRISIEDPEARAFRASVIEWLMLNHPHDCPVCDEGGECHLQDMTVMTGHTYRRSRFPKRTYRNQDLGPFIEHEMNRCIQCYRCVRFYRDVAGGRDLNVFGSHDRLYFGRHEDGVLENEFSGNLVEVCPTGVFTDKTLRRHYTRKWDLQTAPSVCTHCGVGCNTIAGERYGSLRRILNRYNSRVNGYFLCDRGRFGYEFVNSPRRILQPKKRSARGGRMEPIDKNVLLQEIRSLVNRTERMLGIGSPRASLEANFALRSLVGPDLFYLGISDLEERLLRRITDILKQGPARCPSIQEIEHADAVLVLGEDVIHSAPRLALALRQSVRQQPMAHADALLIPRWHDAALREAVHGRRGPLFVADVQSTWLSDVATEAFHGAPADLARLGHAVAHAIDPEAPAVPGFSKDTQEPAQRIARVLEGAERPVVVSGMSTGDETVIEAAANIAWALHRKKRPAGLAYVVPECNSLGLALLGGQPLSEAFAKVHQGEADTVVILENDLYRRADRSSVDAFLDRAAHVVLVDHLEHETASRADTLIPSGTFAESDGTLVNYEGRPQRFFQIYAPEGVVQESWRWMHDIGLEAQLEAAEGNGIGRWRTLDDVLYALSTTRPEFRVLTQVAPSADFTIAGQHVPRAPHRYSGRTAILAHRTVHEPKPPKDQDSPLVFSMEGAPGQPPGPLVPFFWAPGWNSLQALNKYQEEIAGPLREEGPDLRVLQPTPAAVVRYFRAMPESFRARSDAWLVLPLAHIFGSDELAGYGQALSERKPDLRILLGPRDAERLGVSSGHRIRVRFSQESYLWPVEIREPIPAGVAGLWLLPETAGIPLPAWARLDPERAS